MRLKRLELERYGAFENVALDFRPDARVHVVYGRNEAGKTTALAAVSDLLFGFGARTEFAFRHATKDLRLAGTAVAADGSVVSFRRRKGTKATLVGPDDAPLRDDLLASILGGLTREVFGRAFGLGAEALRAGAEDLLAADGEAGASLFAAASGLRGLEELRKGLETEADAIFAPRASRERRFYQAQARYEAARTAVRDRQLRAGDWQAMNARIEELAATYEALAGRRRTAVEARARLERLQRASSAVSEVDQAAADMAAFDDLPEISPHLLAALERLFAAAGAASDARLRAKAAADLAARDLAGLDLDDPALARAAEIERLFATSGADDKARADLPGVEREAAQYDAELARLAAQLGLPDAAAIERGQPSDAARAAMRELIEEGRGLADDERARDHALAAEREALADLMAGQGGKPPIDPKPLREALAGLAEALKPLDRRDELAAACAAEAKALDEAARRLSPPVERLDLIAAAPLPTPETIDRAAKALDRADEAVGRAEADRAEAHAALQGIETDIAALAAGRPIPSPEAIAEARAARDALWRDLRDGLLRSRAPEPSEAAPMVTGFERAVATADALADDAATDADRVARHALLGRRRSEAVARQVATAEALDAARARRAELWSAWEADWARVGVSPGHPDAMPQWASSLAALLARREKNDSLAADVARRDALDRRLAPEIARLGERAGLEASAAMTAPELAARLDARLRSLSDRWEASGKIEAQIAEARRRIDRFERAGQGAETARAGWAVRWAAALPGLGLSSDATPSSAAAALAAWERAPDLLRERANRARRVEGIRRDVERFGREAGALVADLAPDLADMAPDAAVRRLNERLAKARAAETRRAEAARRLEAAARALEDTVRGEAEAAQSLGHAAVALPPDADIAATIARLKARADASARLDDCRRRLAARSEGVAEDELRADLARFEPDEAKGAVADLVEQERRLDHEMQQAFADLFEARNRRDEREAGVGAEAAAAEQRSAEAELAASARDWTVLKVGALLIGEALARSRAARQNPLVARAGALFALLTGEAFSGVAEIYDEDVARLAGRRSSGELVPVAGLSEGTRDQFYLALRLAYLEDYATRAEPAPFIGDDLFSSFDDVRTAHGLKALVEIGDKVQPILFTHHRAVVAAARETLGDAVDVVELDPAPTHTLQLA